MTLIGWRKQWRKLWENPLFRGHPERIVVWMWILDHAEWRTENPDQHMIDGVRRTLELGEISCGRKQIAKDCGISESGVQKILNFCVSEHMLEQQTYNKFRLLKVIKWSEYQSLEHVTEQQGNNKETLLKKKEKKENNYIVRPETESLFDWIQQRTSELGITSNVNKQGLDVFVERYIGKMRLKIELEGYLVWMLDNKKKVLRTSAVGNCFKRQAAYMKRQTLKQLEAKEAINNPAMAERRKKMKEAEEGFLLGQSVKDFDSFQKQS